MQQVVETFNLTRKVKGKPCAIIADTIKGKGVSFAENTANYHNNEMNAELYNQAMQEIENLIRK
jgi:transketolase